MKRWFIAILFAGSFAATSAQEKPVPPPAAATAPADLPAARAVIDRYIEVAGGKDAFLKKNSVLLKGKTEVGGKDLGGGLTLATAKPNKMFLAVDLAGITIKSGFDGKIGWQVNPLTGPSIMEAKELRDMERQADFFAILHEEKDIKSMENLGKVSFEGEDCYKIKIVHTDGSDVTEFYSIKSGLQIGFMGAQESALGTLTATSVNQEHKKFGDLLLPSKVTQKMSGLSQTMIVESVEFDTVPDSMFEAPAEIKALLQAEPVKKEEPVQEEEPKEKAPAPAPKP